MRSLTLLLFLPVIFIPCLARPQHSAHFAPRAKRSSQCVDWYQNYCGYWQNLGYCHPNNYYYASMKVYCKSTCGLCGECADHAQHCSYWKALGYCQEGNYYYAYMKLHCPATCNMCDCLADKVSDCSYWKGLGYCSFSSQYYQYMLLNCQTTCGFCVQPPTTKPVTTNPNTTSKPSTTSAPITTANATTPTSGPNSTTSIPPTTKVPSTTSNPSTANASSTRPNPSTTNAPSSTSNPSTANASSTRPNPSTTNAPSSTSNPSTANASSTKPNPSTTNAPSSTSNPSTTDESSTTSNPSTTSESSSTSNPSTTNAPTATPAENACLKAHNDRRALHGSGPLIWNDTLVQHAQVWADHLAATGVFQHDPNLNGEGENLAFFSGNDSKDCTHALVGWYDLEEPKYDYNNPGFAPETGHFTQVVWKGTTAVGVAQASTGSGLFKQFYIVARYSPAGNIAGQFSQNVGNKQSRA